MPTLPTAGTVRRPRAVKENIRKSISNPTPKVVYQRKPMAYRGSFAPPARPAATQRSALHPASLVKYLLQFVAGVRKKTAVN